MCDCLSNNSLIPNAPEFGKGWKAEFNHGCCDTCAPPTPTVCTTVISFRTRGMPAPLVVRQNCGCQQADPLAQGCNSPQLNVNPC